VNEDDIIASFRQLKQALAGGRRAQVNDLIGRLVAAGAPLGDHWPPLARVALENGELDLAAEVMACFVSDAQGHPLARFQQAAIAAQSGRLGHARTIMAGLPQDVPTTAEHAYSRGTMALNMGDSDEARNWLLTSVRSNPRSGHALLSLAMSLEAGQHQDEAAHILNQTQLLDNFPVEEQAPAATARALVLDRRRDYADAFAAFSDSARHRARLLPYDAGLDASLANAAISGWSANTLAQARARAGPGSHRAIFVTGLPRSGTTLVEQILVSHSQVTDGEELSCFHVLAKDLGDFSAMPLEKLQGWSGITALYLHLASQRFGDGGRFVDKSLEASRYMGVLASALPDAPILWMQRSALDSAWSCFRTFFLRGHAWSNSFAGIAHHFRLERSLERFWQDLLGDRLLRLSYELLVADPERQIRSILDHCGLDFESATLNPERTRRVVSTASVRQVREPINKKGVGAALPYRQWLEPLIEALGAAD
jgi:thioredoxin-like negative regulator of GroEL